MEATEYYFCPTDNCGQRIGTVQEIYLFDYQIKNVKGLLYWENLFLYKDYFSALTSAQN